MMVRYLNTYELVFQDLLNTEYTLLVLMNTNTEHENFYINNFIFLLV